MTAAGGKTGRERRVQRRISVGLPILVRGSDAKGNRFEESLQSYDLSRTGLSFSTAREMAVGENIEIVIPQSGSARKPEKDFTTLAHVVRVQNGDREGVKIVGVQFFGPRLNRVFISESTA